MTRLRLGAPLFGKTDTPEAWLKELRRKGYEAAYVPLKPGASHSLVAEYRQAAEENGIVIAENGAWLYNPMSPDPEEARVSLEKTAELLSFADEIGARCCVNVSGSRGKLWDGPDPQNMTDETFAMVVASVKEILRLAQPKTAKYALEMMPWMYPTGLDDMKRLVDAVDDTRFGIHYDPCNTVFTLERYYGNGAMMDEFVRTFGPAIVSFHVKDLELLSHMTFQIHERCPGDGALEHARLMKATAECCPDAPLMLEHMSKEEDFDRGAAHLRRVAAELGLEMARPQA